MIVDVHMHPLVRDAEYTPNLATVVERFFRPNARNQMERDIRGRTLDDVIGEMDEAGIEKGVIVAMDLTSALGIVMVTNDSVARMVGEHPDRFIGFASVDPNLGDAAVRELERAVRELGLKGLKLAPPVQKFAPNDERFNPLWGKALELGVPVWLHTGHQMSTQGSIAKFGHPMLVDELALRYPDLVIIMGHCACPWFWDAWSVCCRHENVYMDLSVYTDLYHHFPWDAFASYGQEHKLLFATDYPFSDFKSSLKAISDLNISEDFKRKILGENALKVLGISRG